MHDEITSFLARMKENYSMAFPKIETEKKKF